MTSPIRLEHLLPLANALHVAAAQARGRTCISHVGGALRTKEPRDRLLDESRRGLLVIFGEPAMLGGMDQAPTFAEKRRRLELGL